MSSWITVYLPETKEALWISNRKASGDLMNLWTDISKVCRLNGQQWNPKSGKKNSIRTSVNSNNKTAGYCEWHSALVLYKKNCVKEKKYA